MSVWTGAHSEGLLEHAGLKLDFEEKGGCDQMHRRKEGGPRDAVRTLTAQT